MKTFLKLAVAVIVLGGAGLGGWWFLASPEAATVPATVEVRRGSIEKTVLASGVLEANALTSVGAEVSGRIESYDPATQSSQPRKVAVGLDNNVTAQVLSGLEEGEQVVQSGAARPTGGAGAGGMRMGGAPMMRL